MSAFDQIRQAYFGGSRLPARLSPRSQRRLIWVSLAPGMVVVAAVAVAALTIAYHNGELDGSPLIGQQAPLIWRRIWGVANGVLDLSSVALALLIAAGIRSWSHDEGSWAMVIASGLAGIALALGAFVVGTSVVLDQWDAVYDVYADSWARLSGTLGYMAIGYFFLAYCGASAPPETDEPSPPA